jgi:drug/metabolite transporter (DMT)-like permease
MLSLWIVSLLWAFSFGLIKGTLSGIDPNFVSFSRLVVALVIFIPFLRIRTSDKKLAIRLIIIGCMQFGMMYLMYTQAFQTLLAYEVALFTVFTPLYVILYDQIRQSRLYWLPFAAALLAAVGAAIILYSQPVVSDFWRGFLFVQVSNLAFAIGQVEYRRIMKPNYHLKDQDVMGWLYLGGAAVSGLACILWTDFDLLSIKAPQALTLLYLGAIASGLGFFLFNGGSRKVDTNTLAIFNNMKIPLSVTVSLVVFGEDANLINLLAGGGMIAAAFWMNNWMLRRKSQQLLRA